MENLESRLKNIDNDIFIKIEKDINKINKENYTRIGEYTLESFKCHKTKRKIKEKDYDFLFVDTYSILGKDSDFNSKIQKLNPKFLQTKVEEIQKGIKFSKDLLKLNPMSASWVIGYSPYFSKSFTTDIFGEWETKRILMAQISPKDTISIYQQYLNLDTDNPIRNNFISDLYWFTWGTMGLNWNRIGRDIDGGEKSFYGYWNYFKEDNWKEDLIRNMLFRFTKEGDTVVYLDIFEDDLFKQIALEENRHVVKITYNNPINFDENILSTVNKKETPFKKEKINLNYNKIYNEDTFEFLDRLDNGCIDTIITDVPYNITRENIGGNKKGDKKLGAYMHGNYGMNFGEWDSKLFDIKQYIQKSIPKLKSNGQIILFNGMNSIEETLWELEKMGMTIKGVYTWRKPNPVPHQPQLFPLASFEQFIWAVKDKDDYTFNLRNIQKELGNFYEDGVLVYSQLEESRKRIHETQKPISLWESLVEIFSNKGDIVMDNFSGSGTNAVACITLKRKYIGTELSPKYHESSVKRIREFKLHSNKAKRLY